MPRLVPISHSDTPALLALRRTLWQLAFVGVTTAAAFVRIAPQFDMLALWCVLVPLTALTVHFRDTLLGLLRSHRDARRSVASRRRQPPQARRARGGSPTNTRRQVRPLPLRVPSQVRPLAR